MRAARLLPLLALALTVTLAACGDDDSAPGLPLLSGSASGDYAGEAFTAVNGFASIYNDAPVIGLGNGPLSCESLASSSPPQGLNAAIQIPTLAVGTYDNVFVNLYRVSGGDFDSHGSDGATVVITAVSETSVSGTVTFDTTIDDEHFALNGDFEVSRCP
jgi:hypothetical protein